MGKIIKNNFGNFLVICLIFLIVIVSMEGILRVFVPLQIAYANTAGPLSPSTESEARETPHDDETWEDEGLGYLGTSDNTYVQYTGVKLDTDDITYVLYAGGFDFTIAAGSTINGITVEIERHCSAGGAVDILVQLTKSGTRADENKASATGWTGDLNTYYTYGSSSDKWSQTWTVSEANNIGVALAVQATQEDTTIHVDHIKITIDFTPPAALSITAPATADFPDFTIGTGSTSTLSNMGNVDVSGNSTAWDVTVYLGGDFGCSSYTIPISASNALNMNPQANGGLEVVVSGDNDGNVSAQSAFDIVATGSENQYVVIDGGDPGGTGTYRIKPALILDIPGDVEACSTYETVMVFTVS